MPSTYLLDILERKSSRNLSGLQEVIFSYVEFGLDVLLLASFRDGGGGVSSLPICAISNLCRAEGGRSALFCRCAHDNSLTNKKRDREQCKQCGCKEYLKPEKSDLEVGNIRVPCKGDGHYRRLG
jgi:hypothetical protein